MMITPPTPWNKDKIQSQPKPCSDRSPVEVATRVKMKFQPYIGNRVEGSKPKKNHSIIKLLMIKVRFISSHIGIEFAFFIKSPNYLSIKRCLKSLSRRPRRGCVKNIWAVHLCICKVNGAGNKLIYESIISQIYGVFVGVTTPSSDSPSGLSMDSPPNTQ